MTVAPFRMRPVVALFGDSITQQGFGVNGNVGWAALLAAAYTRRADVLNRGFSGYNTNHALELLPRVFGPALEQGVSSSSTTDESDSSSGMLFCTVFFGANDAALLEEGQHVPLETFGENLGKIISRIRARCQNGSSTTNSSTSFPIILFTPPPLHEGMWAAFKESETSDRTNARAREYGNKVKQVGAELDCHVVDTWDVLSGGANESEFGKYLSDGLHLNESGNRLVYQAFMELLQKKYPHLAPMEDGEGKWGKAGIPVEEKLWQELV
jgi:lysophospholipase L1-like esterase